MANPDEQIEKMKDLSEMLAADLAKKNLQVRRPAKRFSYIDEKGPFRESPSV